MYKYNRTVGHPCLTASDTEQIASEIVGIRGDTFCHIIAYTRNNLDYITAGLSPWKSLLWQLTNKCTNGLDCFLALATLTCSQMAIFDEDKNQKKQKTRAKKIEMDIETLQRQRQRTPFECENVLAHK